MAVYTKDLTPPELVVKGINEPSELDYWGLPFMGDNNFFIERVDVFDRPQEPCRWFSLYQNQKLTRGERLHYLSVWTDYETNVRSRGLLFALTDEEESPPPEAWVSIEEAG